MVISVKTGFGQAACAAAFFCAAIFPAFAADAPANSLFFTPEETKQINALADKTVPPNATAHPDIHLGAVMYYGPGDWALWLQGERWTPTTEHNDLRVISVNADEVHLAVAEGSGFAPREITLRPYQTYRVATGQIVEGGAQ